MLIDTNMGTVSLNFQHSNGNQHSMPSLSNSEEYNRQVKELSDASIRASLFAGRCKRLAKFLEDAKDSVAQESLSNSFVQVFSSKTADRTGSNTSHSSGDSEVRVGNCKRVIFLAGYPSAQLAEVGAIYKVDPDFFDTHLNFVCEDHSSCGVHPSFYDLPSRQRDILQLSIQSIGGGAPANEDWHTRRQKFATKMGSYIHGLKMGNGWEAFSSIVRGAEVHDRSRFSLEQFVTIQISRDPDETDRWTVYIWSDAGADLELSPEGPWGTTGNDFHFRPVSLHPQRSASTAKKHHIILGENTKPGGKRAQHSLPLLRDVYSQIFKENPNIENPIYALDPILSYFCASEVQYLDMIASVLEASIQSSRHPRDFRKKQSSAETRAILLNSHRMLRHRSSRIRDVLEYVQFHGSDVIADSAATFIISSLLRDLNHLLLSNGELMLRCQHEVDIITNEAIFEDAQAGIALSRGSQKFAVFVAIYAPVTFTCSVFGMNFVNIADTSWGFELWAMVTIPICLISFLIVSWNSELIQRVVGNVRFRLPWMISTSESTLAGKDEEKSL